MRVSLSFLFAAAALCVCASAHKGHDHERVPFLQEKLGRKDGHRKTDVGETCAQSIEHNCKSVGDSCAIVIGHDGVDFGVCRSTGLNFDRLHMCVCDTTRTHTHTHEHDGERPRAGIRKREWDLVRYANANGKIVDVPAGVKPTLVHVVPVTLRPKHRAGGFGGCNTWSASEVNTHSHDKSLVRFTGIISTKMMCPEPAMSVESQYFANLGDVTSWTVDGTTLTMSDAHGDVVLVFKQTVNGTPQEDAKEFGQTVVM